ncbi:mitogen-activated protein kinase kinase 9-like [Pyrus communis]|uniref:mitogen-activated protein kinase kinase 9-like n=1 Tax=Pyrus communis TaxID=23211 RepID=UPI0035C0FA36
MTATNYSSTSISVADLETLKLHSQGNGSKVYKPLGDIKILMEFMDSGNLETLLKDNGTFSEAKLAYVAHQVLSGLNYLHTHNIAHRDIRPTNILVNSNMEVKITDFGISEIMSLTSDDACSSPVGTFSYRSPERFNKENCCDIYSGYASDIWSFSLTIMELYVGRYPLLPMFGLIFEHWA